MAQITMYGAINNSPKTVVSVSMTASDTTIQVENVDALPAPPNLATLGEDENAEVISYSGKESNTLTGVVRGIKGTTASPWPTGTMVYRAYTAYDHDAFKANIEDLENRKVASVNNVMPDDNKNILLSADDIEETASRVFVSPQEKAKWNDIPGENLVINGGMQIWQRGESLTEVGTDTYTADRLIMHETAAGAFTVEKYNDPEMGLCAKITCTAAGWINLGTVVELVGVFPALTGSFYAKCSKSFENTTVISAISYDDGEKGQADTISTRWQRVVFALSNVTANEKLYFTCLRGGGVEAGDVFYLTGIKLEAGGQATPFVPRPYAEEMALCQRYYQTHELSLPPIKENTNAALYAMPRFNFPTPMRVAPTAKYVDRSGNSGLSYYSTHSNVPNISKSNFTVITDRVAKIVFAMPSGVTMALGDYVYTNLTLDAEIY